MDTVTLNVEQIESLKKQNAAGKNKAQIAREFGISRETLYQFSGRETAGHDLDHDQAHHSPIFF